MAIFTVINSPIGMSSHDIMVSSTMTNDTVVTKEAAPLGINDVNGEPASLSQTCAPPNYFQNSGPVFREKRNLSIAGLFVC